MTERQMLQTFVKMAKECGKYYIHKDGDTYGGHAKPYDFYIVWEGVFFAVEAKRNKSKLTENQQKGLVAVQELGGGMSLVARIHNNRDIHFYPLTPKDTQEKYVLVWSRGRYKDIENLPQNLQVLG